MTAVYITIDTEYSAGLAIRLGLHAREAVYARSIAGHTAHGAGGIEPQVEVCLLYTSDAADAASRVAVVARRIVQTTVAGLASLL